MRDTKHISPEALRREIENEYDFHAISDGWWSERHESPEAARDRAREWEQDHGEPVAVYDQKGRAL